MMGSSLNSIANRQGVITPLEALGSKFISEAYEELWRTASPLSDEIESRKAKVPADKENPPA